MQRSRHDGKWRCDVQAPVDVLLLADTVAALHCSEAAVDVIAARFIDEACVTWSDVHAAGIDGRDIARVRQHLARKVRMCSVRS